MIPRRGQPFSTGCRQTWPRTQKMIKKSIGLRSCNEMENVDIFELFYRSWYFDVLFSSPYSIFNAKKEISYSLTILLGFHFVVWELKSPLYQGECSIILKPLGFCILLITFCFRPDAYHFTKFDHHHPLAKAAKPSGAD